MKVFIYLFFIISLFLKPVDLNAQIFSNKKSYEFDSTGQVKPRAIKLIEINSSFEYTNKEINKYTKELANIRFRIDIDSLIKKQGAFLREEAELFNAYNPNNLSQYFLENDYRAWISYQLKLKEANNIINEKLEQIEQVLRNLEFEYEIWQLTKKKMYRTKNVPPGIKNKINQVLFDLSNLIEQYELIKKKLLIWDNKITDLLLLSNSVVSKINTLQRNLRDSLFVRNEPPIWKVEVDTSDIFPVGGKLKRSFNDNIRIIKNFAFQHKFNWIFFFALLVTFLFFALRKKYLQAGFDNSKKRHKKIMVIFEKHWFASYLLLLLTLGLSILSIMPLSLSSLLATLMLFSVFFIIPDFMGKSVKIKVIMVLIIYLMNEFEILMWYFGELSRLYLLFETATGVLITYYFGTNKFKKPQKSDSLFIQRSYWFSIVLMGIYVVAFLTNIFGYVNLAVLLLKVAAQSATIILLIYSIQQVIKLLVTAVCDLGRADKYSALSGYWDSIEKRVYQFLDIFAVFYGVKLILGVLEIYRPVYEYLVNILTAELSIGTISITLGGVLGMILIFLIAYFISKTFEIVFVNHKLVRKKISPGIAFAIATTFKYVVTFFGLILGIAYAGVDIGKFSLFTGALGVGIGFGLQNIVNNFISGLVLLYERPVEVGDTIEVGDLMGEVKKIGVRASRVRTYDGAEVVVPNGNIISNDLINWTLSDDKRRLQIKVGVAYGSDVNKVLKILQKVAVNNEHVFPEPAPRALFEEFGDSSLNFRLLCWIPFDRGLSTRSELTVAIYNAFEEENIEIPFPQMDVYVKEFNQNGLTKKPDIIMPKAPANESKRIEKDKGNDNANRTGNNDKDNA